MTSQTTQLFDRLGRREYEPLLRRANGVMRFDIVDDDGREDAWCVAIDHGHVAVSQQAATYDARLRAPRALFVQIATGDANATSAMLRGAIEVEGEWRLIVLAQRLFRRTEEERP
jgi:putative sterol carrier protein